METKDIAVVIEALGYNTECHAINRHHELFYNITRDTFLRKCRHKAEGAGSTFEGVECGPYITDFKDTPDTDIVFNLTEFSGGFCAGFDKVNVENDLNIIPCKNFPGYINVILRQKKIPNSIFHPLNYTKDMLAKQELVKTKINGPSFSKYSNNSDIGITKMDMVLCIAYKSWPMEANKWVSRNKPNNWPSKELIEKIKSKGFNLAPIGHSDCEDKDYQWRIGIRGEKELVWSLNETQILCYVALRLILKEDIQLIDKDVLSSYHMKNIIFWCAEQESCQWTKENFEICLQACINKLITFIKSRNFPHYFIEARNLINSKMTRDLQQQFIDALTKYSSNVLAILSFRKFEGIKKITDGFKRTLLNCAKQCAITNNCILFHTITLGLFYGYQHTIWETYEGHNTVDSLQNAKKILSFLRNTKRHFIIPYIAYAKSMLGLLYYSRYRETDCKDYNLKDKAGKLLISSLTFETVSLKFRVATLYLMENKFKECLCICKAILNNPSKYKTPNEKKRYHDTILFNITSFTGIVKDDLLTELTKLQESICAIFYEPCISEKCGDGRLAEAKTVLSKICNISEKNECDAMNIFLDLSEYYNSYDILLIIYQNLPNLLVCEMSFNVPYLASEKWAVPDVIQYELLSVQRCHPESSLYGIYIDPVLNCLMLSFLSYTKTNYLTQSNKMLTKMAKYIEEYSYNGKPVAAELPHSLPLYRVYNIVAYCFLKAGRYHQAIKYILNSLKLYGKKKNTAFGYIRCAHLYIGTFMHGRYIDNSLDAMLDSFS